jgi:hypothetical protein
MMGTGHRAQNHSSRALRPVPITPSPRGVIDIYDKTLPPSF